MDKPVTTLGLHLGALSDPIRKQLHAQGLKMDIGKCEHRQMDADALTRLHVRCLVPPSSIEKARKKLIDLIAKEVVPL